MAVWGFVITAYDEEIYTDFGYETEEDAMEFGKDYMRKKLYVILQIPFDSRTKMGGFMNELVAFNPIIYFKTDKATIDKAIDELDSVASNLGIEIVFDTSHGQVRLQDEAWNVIEES